MTTVQIQTNGQIVIFKSFFAFLDLLGYSHTYTKTAHYKSKYGDETPQKLWNRVTDARQKLERLMQQYSPTIDPETGMKSYRHNKVIVCPVGYIPPILREHVTLEPASADSAPVAKGLSVNGAALDATADTIPIMSAEDQLIAIKILDALDNLILECALTEGTEAAKTFKDSITAIKVDQRRVESVNGDPEHWLVNHLNTAL